jgi:hypothetical protein
MEDIEYFSQCDSQKMMEILRDWVDLINCYTPKNLLKEIFPIENSLESYYIIKEDRLEILLDNKDPNASKICFLLMMMLHESQVFLPCPRKSFWQIQ